MLWLTVFFTAMVFVPNNINGDSFSISLKRTKSTLQTFADMGLHPSKVHTMLEDSLIKEKKTTNASVRLYKYLDTEFYGEILIGHPGQNFKVIFDTAWANTWVPSDLCPRTQIACLFHNRYDHKSSQYKANGTKFNVNLGGHNLTGMLSTDLFHVGQVNVTDQTFAEISKIPWIFAFSKSDGVLGLAFDKYSVDGVTPVFYNMLKQGVVAKPVFSIYMNRDPISKNAGTIFFGGVEKRHFRGNFTFAEIVQVAYWQFHMDGISIKGANKTLCRGGCDAIADSSTNVITGPENDIIYINQQIRARPFYFGRYIVDCALIGHLPTITFTISDKKFTLKSKDYIQQMSWGGVMFCLSSFAKSDFPSSYGEMWSLGGAFLSRFYVQFDLGNYRIGFAEALL